MINPYFEKHLQKNFHTSSDVIRLCCEAPASNIKMWSIHLEKNFHTLSNVIRLHCISIKYWHIQNQWVLSLVEDFPSDIKYYWHKTIKNPWIWEKRKYRNKNTLQLSSIYQSGWSDVWRLNIDAKNIQILWV